MTLTTRTSVSGKASNWRSDTSKWMRTLVAPLSLLLLGVTVFLGHLEVLAAGGAALVAWFIAKRFPGTTTVLLVALTALPQYFGATTLGKFALVRPEDVLMVGMTLCVASLYFTRSGRQRLGVLRAPLMVFGLWAIVNTLRNIGLYGLAAPGELRYMYLALVVPAYAAVSLRDELVLRRVVAWSVGIAVAPMILLAPIVNRTLFRFSSASLALGLLLGMCYLWASRDQLGLSRLPYIVTMMLGVLLTISNAHRSVWAAGLGLLGGLLLFGVVSPRSVLKWLVPAVLALGLFASVVWLAIPEFSALLVGRAEAAIALEDTAGGRVAHWNASLPRARAVFVTGEGFGGGWAVYIPELERTVQFQPHNYYLQTVIKLGAVGLGLYIWLAVSYLRVLLLGRSRLRGSERGLVDASLATVVALHVYMMFYSMDIWPLVFLGLGLAAAVQSHVGGRETALQEDF